ncbi:MAG: carbamate kinase [Candidatus Marinimicrobia bacterium]|nr:carbamate kinase [Candidatus Neomarinimicrobiota bacterium]
MRPNRSVMIALGGNALSPKGSAGDITVQFAHTRKSLEAIMHFVDFDYNICITHGNGPQVGDELLRMDLTHEQVPPLPLGLCVAGTQGTIGYMIQQSLQNRLKEAHVDREVVTLVSQVIVDKDDPSIQNPTKFIGQRYPENEAKSLAKKFGWTVKEQNPGEWRRVVSSPLPQFIMHGFSTKTLVDHGTIVLCAGGGGIPVHYKDSNTLEGLDAVIDKDLAAALMGRIIKAHELWIITDVECAYLDFNKASQRPIKKCTASQAKQYLDEGQFQKGSMAPKFEAAIYFLKYHGEKVIITSISHVKEAIGGRSGTTIVRDNAT